jgi:hypothetical protein
LLADYPYLEREDILQALRYAAWLWPKGENLSCPGREAADRYESVAALGGFPRGGGDRGGALGIRPARRPILAVSTRAGWPSTLRAAPADERIGTGQDLAAESRNQHGVIGMITAHPCPVNDLTEHVLDPRRPVPVLFCTFREDTVGHSIFEFDQTKLAKPIISQDKVGSEHTLHLQLEPDQVRRT